MASEIFASRDKEIKKKTEEERKESIRQTMNFARDKKELAEKMDAKRKFHLLRSMVERHLLSPSDFSNQTILETDQEDVVKEILRKIEEIEEITQVDEVLPKELRITAEEYVMSQDSEESRTRALEKVDAALKHLYIHFSPEWSLSFMFFQTILLSLQKKAKIVQEHTVDIRNELLKTQS
jgi:hypothetical protein